MLLSQGNSLRVDEHNAENRLDHVCVYGLLVELKWGVELIELAEKFHSEHCTL